MKRQTRRDVAMLREYLRRRRPAEAEERPTRAEIIHDRRTRGDYRLRTYLLRPGVPPTPEYRRARAALEAARTRPDDQDATA